MKCKLCGEYCFISLSGMKYGVKWVCIPCYKKKEGIK